MGKKYFFFDIDGTLTDRATGLIVPSALEALEKLRAAGHFVAINTGRAHYKARKFFDQHGFDNMVCNGGMGIVINKELVENRSLDFEKALWVYHYCIDNGIGVLAACDDSQKVYAKDFTFYDQIGPRREPTTYIIDPDFDPADFGVFFFNDTATTEKKRKSLPLLLPRSSARAFPSRRNSDTSTSNPTTRSSSMMTRGRASTACWNLSGVRRRMWSSSEMTPMMRTCSHRNSTRSQWGTAIRTSKPWRMRLLPPISMTAFTKSARLMDGSKNSKSKVSHYIYFYSI